MEQVGRTAELARTFGIDFFAVLFRGSQYRVESMMARLAHTQNYLLPSPSKEQVGLPGGGACRLLAQLHIVCVPPRSVRDVFKQDHLLDDPPALQALCRSVQ